MNNCTETWAFKVHGNQYQVAGIPDVICITRGAVVFFEVKRPGGKVSKIQKYTLEKIRKAGGHAFVVESVEQVRYNILALSSVNFLGEKP